MHSLTRINSHSRAYARTHTTTHAHTPWMHAHTHTNVLTQICSCVDYHRIRAGTTWRGVLSSVSNRPEPSVMPTRPTLHGLG